MLSKEEIENKEELLKKISKEQYGDEWFIETAILSYERQQEKTYTFFRDDNQIDLLRKYNFCQRPDSTNMSLKRFTKNGEIEGWMSESLAEQFGLLQVDLNEFIHKFVKSIIKMNIQLETNNKKLIEKLNKKIRYFEEYDEIIATSNDNYADGTVIKRFIDEFKEILKIAKGEKE